MKAKTRLLALSLAFLMVFGTLALSACDEQTGGDKKSYDVTYNLNYDGADKRVYPVQSGTNAPEWKATREGYRIEYWATDSAGKNKYDFSDKVYKDLSLYAVWKVKSGVTTVTFDFGYAGATNKVIEVEKGSTIAEKYKPQHKRFGMELVGWYADKDFTEEFKFGKSAVKENMVLHAKYSYTMNIPRNADGSIKYENTRVYIWNSVQHVCSSEVLQKLADDFNAEHKGKIVVSTGTSLLNQDDVFLRIQQTPEQMRCYTTYYPIADIYSFAGLDVSNDDYYEGATNECKNKGVLLQVPVAAYAPYFVYNKTLMSRYNGSNPLPSNYSELSALLKKAAKGESSNASFKSIVTTTQWSYMEAPSFTAFAQNEADYYNFADGVYLNKWLQEGVMQRATAAMTTTYDLFGANGLNKGAAMNLNGDAIYDYVSKQNALMGMQTWAGGEAAIASNSELGVLPISGLMTDIDGEAKNRVPVHTWGIGFYNKATNVLADPLKICAAAEFAKYVSENAYKFAEKGFVPLHKKAINNPEYVNSKNPTVKIIRSACLPENYYTLAGCANIKLIVNKIAAEGVIIPFLTDNNATREMIESKTKELYAQVAGMVS